MSASSLETPASIRPGARLDGIAALLDAAMHDAKAVPQIAEPLTLAEAYAVQKTGVDLRLQRGERMAGIKMGFTSRAKMIQMGVSDVIWGRLTDAMQIADGGALNLRRFVHPRVEPEVAFRLKTPLRGHVTAAEALAAVDGVAPGLEIIDSRFEAFKFSLTDVVADNASSSAFVIGPWSSPDVDMDSRAMAMSFDGQVETEGSTSAILDHPINSLIAAARLAEENELTLEVGWIVLAGAATAAAPLRPGVQVSLTVAGLGRVGFSVGT